MKTKFYIGVRHVHFKKLLQTIIRQYIPFFVLIGSVMLMSKNSYGDEPALSATALNATYAKLDKQLSNNQFQRPLFLNSTESPHDLKGEIYAVVDYPFSTVSSALNGPENWCDVLILHVNIKYCHASIMNIGAKNPTPMLSVDLGKKFDQPLADAYRVDFNYREVKTAPDYFAIELFAENGPLGTNDYRIWVEATPLKDGRTFLHFTYTYSFGLSGRLAMQAYLATAGRNKVGFTATGKLDNGQQDYIKGIRGVVERNTMRYYIAIDAYLAALKKPASEQLEKRLQNWYEGTNQYPQQLHEVERDDYLVMKRKEYKRQQVAQ